MVQLADLFSVPEISLLCNVAEYFEKEQLNYHPEILFRDVKVKSNSIFFKKKSSSIQCNDSFFVLLAIDAIMPSDNAWHCCTKC